MAITRLSSSTTGYSEVPLHLPRRPARSTSKREPLFERGYAVIQSGYSSAAGWALAEAYPETEQLRQYFLRRYGPARHGQRTRKKTAAWKPSSPERSMGGALVVATLELNPKPYVGGLNLCGSVGPTDLAFQRRFAFRAAFDFFFPGLLPPLDPVPADLPGDPASSAKRVEERHAKKSPRPPLPCATSPWLHTDHEVAEPDGLFHLTSSPTSSAARTGNAFDNRNFLYSGTDAATAPPPTTPSTTAYAATPPKPAARDYLLHHYTPTGRLYQPPHGRCSKPPTTRASPPRTLEVYKEQVAIAGFDQNLVQQYVHRDGHCTFTPEEIGRTFDDSSSRWTHTGRRPIPGDLPASSRER